LCAVAIGASGNRLFGDVDLLNLYGYAAVRLSNRMGKNVDAAIPG
jgi:hypothetical protein